MNQLRVNIEKEAERAAKHLGYHPDVFAPRTYNEKILWKKFFDRDPLLVLTSDKLQVKKYIAERIGERYAVPTCFSTDDPEGIQFHRLPPDYVVKPNHGSGMYLFVRNGNADKKEIIRKCNKWLSQPFGANRFEWAYQAIPRRIVIEPLLTDSFGNIPQDFKLYMSGGRCLCIHVDDDRFTEHSRVTYTPDWKVMTGVRLHCAKLSTPIPQPPELPVMLMLAEKLASPFTFCRVDMYLVSGRIYVGEITHYPGSGHVKITPYSVDLWMGEQIKIANYE